MAAFGPVRSVLPFVVRDGQADPVDAADQGLERGGNDIAVDSDAVAVATVTGDFHEGAGLGVAVVAAGHHGAFFVATYLDDDAGFLQGVNCGIDRAVAFAGKGVRRAVDFDIEADALAHFRTFAVFEKMMTKVADR